MSWRSDPLGNVMRILGDDVTEVTMDETLRQEAVAYLEEKPGCHHFRQDSLFKVAYRLKKLAKRSMSNDQEFLPGIYLALIQLIHEDKRVRGR
jgi:hypothetical protein